MSDTLREQAAREIFEQLDLADGRLTAVHPRAEHAWLIGVAEMRKLELVGARGLNPAGAKCRVVVPPAILVALAA
ncbi:MAG TPA: hypothetical protein VK845_06480 [Gemmatimonadales bacterium]|nr:hypothetical protein [Gemmatimonadales bacterium]